MTERYTSQTVVVLNAGLAGMHAAEDRERFNDALSEAKPELLLLWHGGNDLLALAGTSPAEIDAGITRTVNAVEDLVRDATRRGMHVMLATQTPVSGGLQRGGAAPYVARYNDQLKSMAAKKDAQIVDLHAQVDVTLVGRDGLHLTEAGYQRVAEVFGDAIKARYEISPLTAVR
jgi:lysophospholipase L1-like esterase